MRATIIAGVALPLSLIATFGVMWFAGFSLDNLSLMALTIGTGFVVDDAIVMIENIVRHMENGEKPLEAALRGASEIGFTVISLTLSLIAVFIPLLFMTGLVGRMFREFALTLTIAVVASAIVSLTLTPMMCSRLLRHGGGGDNALSRRFSGLIERTVAGYHRSLLWVLRRQRETLFVTLATLAATIFLYAVMPKGFLPLHPLAVSSVLQDGVASLQNALEAPAQEQPPQDRSLALDPELISDFIVESREHLVNIEAQVLTLEREPFDSEALNAVFRGFHTIKGLAGFLELWEVQKLAHEVETVLDRARNSEWTINPAGIDVILESSDYLRRWLVHMEASLHHEASEAPARDEALLARVTRLSSEPGAAAPAGLASLVTAVSVNEEKGDDAKPPVEALPVGEKTSQKASEPVISPTPAAVAPAAGRRQETMAVKVDTAKLDYLVDMAGEMVIAESLVRHDQELAALKNPLLHRKMAHLTRITAELQKTAMAMRLVPIGPLFRRMARLVRDLSRQFGKQVEMETQGDEIELDRTIVEELADPLMHMVRNALDHGIGTPAERQAAGKPGAARLLLKANHQAGQVVIEITDDGRGLNRTKIIEKAVQKGLIASADGLSDSEVYNLIFQPGFSTAAQVTNVSGRGRRHGRGAAPYRETARPHRDPLDARRRRSPFC